MRRCGWMKDREVKFSAHWRFLDCFMPNIHIPQLSRYFTETKHTYSNLCILQVYLQYWKSYGYRCLTFFLTFCIKYANNYYDVKRYLCVQCLDIDFYQGIVLCAASNTVITVSLGIHAFYKEIEYWKFEKKYCRRFYI